MKHAYRALSAGRIPTCVYCGLPDPVWRCALVHGAECEREECKPAAVPPCRQGDAERVE